MQEQQQEDNQCNTTNRNRVELRVYALPRRGREAVSQRPSAQGKVYQSNWKRNNWSEGIIAKIL